MVGGNICDLEANFLFMHINDTLNQFAVILSPMAVYGSGVHKNMSKKTMRDQFLREFRKLSPVGRGEVFKYAQWMLDIEKQERLAALRDNAFEDQVNDSHGVRINKRPLLAMQKWLSNWGFSI